VRLSAVFWTLVALDGAMFLALLVGLLKGGGSDSGGREMGVFFFVLLPVAILAAAVLLYVFSSGTFWKVAALLLVAGPGLFIAGGQLRSAWIGHRVAQTALGRGYFKSAAIDEMSAAVVQGDTHTLQRLAPTVDIDRVGERGMTLMRLAVEQVYEAKTPLHVTRATAVVRTLLGLGAKPAPGMDISLKLPEPTVLAALLAAGADPNQEDSPGHPVVFSWLSVLPVANLQLLIDRGLNVDVTEYETPLALEAALKRRWDLVVLLGKDRANLRVPRRDGRTIEGEVINRLAEAQAEGTVPAPELLQVRELLDAS
jgi:hypothetical protein